MLFRCVCVCAIEYVRDNLFLVQIERELFSSANALSLCAAHYLIRFWWCCCWRWCVCGWFVCAEDFPSLRIVFLTSQSHVVLLSSHDCVCALKAIVALKSKCAQSVLAAHLIATQVLKLYCVCSAPRIHGVLISRSILPFIFIGFFACAGMHFYK